MQMRERLARAKAERTLAAGQSWRETSAREAAEVRKAKTKRSMPRAMLEERCAMQEKLLRKARTHVDDALCAARAVEKFEDITHVVTVVDRLESLMRALVEAGIGEE